MFKYIVNKVVKYYQNLNLKLPKSLIFSIINCNNLDYIIEILEKFNLDINYIDIKSRQHPLLFALQRCSLNTILDLDKKFNCKIKYKIKKSRLYQKFVFRYLFKYINIKNNRFYILHENERVKILKYFINVISNDIIFTNMNELLEYKGQIKYDKIKTICINKLLNSNIRNICNYCNKLILKTDDYFLINKFNSNIYHKDCFNIILIIILY